MKKIIINDNQIGLLFRRGHFVKPLGAGKYRIHGDTGIEVLPRSAAIVSSRCEIETLLSNPEFAASVSAVEVGDQHVALHFVDGRYDGALAHGRYAFWNGAQTHEFRMVDISDPEIGAGIPRYILPLLPRNLCTRFDVAPGEIGRVYYNGEFIRLLEPGTYYFWYNGTVLRTDIVDARVQQLEISGQEILTQDKVTLRVNFVLGFQVTDFVKIESEVLNFRSLLYTAAQLALREYVGAHTLDEILADKEAMSKTVYDHLKAREGEFFVRVTDAGVKDIILPGEIREIMNTVLVAQKRAQANVITRREEVASTRSLLNTAKLMEENQTLYKLKELEFVERICENVGSIHLSGSGDILGQLTALLQSSSAS